MSPVTLPKALNNPLRILFGYVILPMTDSRNHKSSVELCHINQKEALFMPCLILLLSAILTSVQSIVRENVGLSMMCYKNQKTSPKDKKEYK